MIKGLTMEAVNNGLQINGGLRGRIMNKREVESMKNELKAIEREVKQEMNSFNKVVEFYNTMTIEDVYSTVEYMDAEVVGVVGDDIEIGVADEDRVELMYGDSYINDGIRYTESIDLMYGTTLY